MPKIVYIFSCVIFCEFSSFAFYTQACKPFWVNFVKDVRSMSKLFFFCTWMSSYSSTICWKDCLCSIVLLLLFCQISIYIYVDFFLKSLFCSIDQFPYCFVNATLAPSPPLLLFPPPSPPPFKRWSLTLPKLECRFLHLRRTCKGRSWKEENVILTCLLLVSRW